MGSVNNLKIISDLAHKKNALKLLGDGVSFAPHGFPDVKKLDVDFNIQFVQNIWSTFSITLWKRRSYSKNSLIKIMNF